MHIAVCFWGLLRSLSYTIDSIQEFCLKPIEKAGYTYDILIHTYKFKGEYKNLRNHEKSGILNFSEWHLLNPNYVYIEDQDNFDLFIDTPKFTTIGDPWNNNLSSLKNSLRALNSLDHLSNVIENVNNNNQNKSFHSNSIGNVLINNLHKKYDAIIFIRPDMLYINELPINLLNIRPSNLYLPDFHRSCDGGQYNDRMAMGDVKSLLSYGKRLNSAYNYSLKSTLQSERFLYDHLLKDKINVVEIPFRFKRTRIHGIIHERDSLLFTPEYQLSLSSDGLLPHKTIWPLSLFYKRDHDDPFNVYCSPNKKILPNQYLMYKNINYNKNKSNLINNLSNDLNFVPNKLISMEENSFVLLLLIIIILIAYNFIKRIFKRNVN